MAASEPIPYYPGQAPIAPHLRTSDELLAVAVGILDLPDEEIGGELRAQASEKLWGAVTRRLKFFADAHNWYYCEHGIAVRLVERIAEALDTDPPQLSGRFDSAERAYDGGWSLEDEMDPLGVRVRLPSIRTLCARLDDAHRTLPLDLTPPTDQYYRAAAQRCAERRARRAVASA